MVLLYYIVFIIVNVILSIDWLILKVLSRRKMWNKLGPLNFTKHRHYLLVSQKVAHELREAVLYQIPFKVFKHVWTKVLFSVGIILEEG